MQSHVDCIVHRPVCSVGKLKRIQRGSSDVLQVGHSAGRKKFGKRLARTRVDHALSSMPLKLMLNEHFFLLLTNAIPCWWAELVYIAFSNKAGYLHLVSKHKISKNIKLLFIYCTKATRTSQLYLYSAFTYTNCNKATAQYQNRKIVSIM